MEWLAFLGLGCIGLGVACGFLGLWKAGGIGISPVLAYANGFRPEAGLLLPGTPSRVLGARLGLLGLGLQALGLVLLAVAMAAADWDPGAPPLP